MASLAPFISRDDLGDLLGQDLSASDPALIAVDAACDICRNEAEQTFNEVTADEVIFDGPGTDALLLPELPVTAVDTVEVDGVVDTNWVLSGHGILLRKPIAWISNGTVPIIVWPIGRQNIAVTYDHGYADADFPRDIRVVALRVAARLLTTTSSPALSGVTSESLGAYSISYSTSQAAQAAASGLDVLTAGEKAILRKYKQSKSF